MSGQGGGAPRTALALVSDVHGNRPALEALVEDLERRGDPPVVCLGDVASFGPDPAGCVRRVRELGWPTVRGNTDEDVLRERSLDDVPPGRRDARTPTILALENWSARALGDAERTWLAALPPTLEWDVGGLRLLAAHAAPRSSRTLVPASAPVEAVDALLDAPLPDVYAHGHTHEPYALRWRLGWRVNPGSVGLPFRSPPGARYEDAWNPTAAEYAWLEVEDGEVAITLRRAPYPLEALEEAVERAGMPEGDWWLRGFRAYAGGG